MALGNITLCPRAPLQRRITPSILLTPNLNRHPTINNVRRGVKCAEYLHRRLTAVGRPTRPAPMSLGGVRWLTA